ncbi:hypothetical protein JCM1840_003623 [Sporobolomyces johnsonii]
MPPPLESPPASASSQTEPSESASADQPSPPIDPPGAVQLVGGATLSVGIVKHSLNERVTRLFDAFFWRLVSVAFPIPYRTSQLRLKQPVSIRVVRFDVNEPDFESPSRRHVPGICLLAVRVRHFGFLELAWSSLCTTQSLRLSFDDRGTERPKFPAPRLGKRTGRIKHVFRSAVVFPLGDCPFTIIRIARCNLDDDSLK